MIKMYFTEERKDDYLKKSNILNPRKKILDVKKKHK